MHALNLKFKHQLSDHSVDSDGVDSGIEHCQWGCGTRGSPTIQSHPIPGWRDGVDSGLKCLYYTAYAHISLELTHIIICLYFYFPLFL